MTSPLSFRSTSRAHFAGLMLGAMLSFGLARSAAAKAEFPGHLEKNLDMKCIPTCLLCHDRPEGGPEHLRSAQSALYMLLAQEAKPDAATLELIRNTDSDHDGMNDLQEIKDGRDPLIFGDNSVCSPSYGCGARIAKPAAPESDGSALVVSIGAAISLALWQRRRAVAELRK